MHCVAPGTQVPAHCPVAHTKGQTCASTQLASWLQTCCVDPLHRVVPGAQLPVHDFVMALHKKGQGRLVHCPSAPHVRSALPVHSDAPGAHTPLHWPVLASQTLGQVWSSFH